MELSGYNLLLHPNVPCPEKREANGWIQRCIWNPLLSFAERCLPLFVCALLVPEYVLTWAIRQFLRARKIVRENEGKFKYKLIFINGNHSKQLTVRCTMVDDPRVLYDHGRVPSFQA